MHTKGRSRCDPLSREWRLIGAWRSSQRQRCAICRHWNKCGSRRSTGGLSRQIDLSFRFFACTRTFEPQLPEIEPWRVDLGKTKDDPTVMISRDVRSRTGGYESAILYQECLCKPCDGAERSAGGPVRRREWRRLKAAFTSP